MRNLLKTVPNQMTAARLVLIPVMWVLVWFKLPVYIGIGVFLSFMTDVLDGLIARKLNQVSEFGGKFDSLADNLLLPSALVWLWLFQPAIYAENFLICAIAITLYFASLFLGAIKFKRFANLHLYASKAASVAMYLFASYSLIMDRYNQAFFYVAAIMFLISCTDNLLLQLVCNEINDHMGSVLLVWQQRKSRPPVSSYGNTERHP